MIILALPVPVQLFWLLVLHALADYPLQGDYLSRAKRRNSGFDLPWWMALLWHAFIHAGAVALVTGQIELGLAELVVHMAIDYLKCANRFGFTTDQALHVAFKGLWAIL
jgi:hypothetical protein